MTDLPNTLTQQITQITYLVSALLFIFGLKKMSSPYSAQKGLIWAGIGMLIAVVITYFSYEIKSHYLWMTLAMILGGSLAFISANKAKISAMPQMIALYNGLGGGAAAAIAAATLIKLEPLPDTTKYLAIIGALIGSISFSGSLIAFAKLQGLITKPLNLPMHQWVNVLILVMSVTFGAAIVLNGNDFEISSLILFLTLALAFGLLMTISLNNEDMPVAISLFNGMTGLAVGLEGYVLSNPSMMIAGALVAAAGIKLTLSISRSMNIPISNIFLGNTDNTNDSNESYDLTGKRTKELQANDAAMMMAFAQKIIIVPGYGMAVSQAQHKVAEMTKQLEAKGVNVKFAIHPAAGRVPGHMNILLAEAGIPYDSIYNINDINNEFTHADAVLVLGANDIVNPSAHSNNTSPIFGMPILNADKAKNIIVIKRGNGTGFSNIDNPLFSMKNTGLIYGDVKSVLSEVLINLKEL